MEIKLVNFLIVNGGKLKAFASVKVDDIVIHDFRIIQQDGQRAWVSAPQVSWKGNQGKIKYKALLDIPGELMQRIEVAILSAWEKEKNSETKF